MRPGRPATLRITGGVLGGRRIAAPLDRTIRPTAEKIRQAIFNILNARGLVEDSVVLDAFCGTGAMGIEALSHAARRTVFFDVSPQAVELCCRNTEALGITERVWVRRIDATRPGPLPSGGEPASLVFLDPPYHKDLIGRAVEALRPAGWIAPQATLVLEMGREETLDLEKFRLLFQGDDIEVLVHKRYGETQIFVLGQAYRKGAFTEA